MALPGKETGVRQQVYLPVHRVVRYTGSLWAKHVERPGGARSFAAQRATAPATVLARAPLALAGGDWASYEFALELPAGRGGAAGAGGFRHRPAETKRAC